MCCVQLEVLSEWITSTYLDVGVLTQIQQQFEAESEIALPNFLLVSKHLSTSPYFPPPPSLSSLSPSPSLTLSLTTGREV